MKELKVGRNSTEKLDQKQEEVKQKGRESIKNIGQP